METPVKNLVDSIDLTSDDALLPLFECVVNSIISLKQQSKVKKENKNIQIQIYRGKPPTQPEFYGINTISRIKITDNGLGFDDRNFRSFKTPLTQLYRDNFGCKGVGRFTWLAAFDVIIIKSNYFFGNSWKYREFKFSVVKEIFDIVEKDSDNKKYKTSVELINCNNPIILDKTSIDIKFIAYEIMQHCLIYYLNGDLPLIEIQDENAKDPEIVNALYENLAKDRERTFKIKNQEFKIYIMKTQKENKRNIHYIHYCANSRVVGRPKNLKRINSLFSYPIVKEDQQFYLDIYVVSEYLNKNTYKSRNGFTIPQENDNSIFGHESIISFQDIENGLSLVLEELFDDHVKETKDKNIKDIEQYVITEAPRYRSLLRNKDCFNTIPYGLPNEKKEEHLYRIAFEASVL